MAGDTLFKYARHHPIQVQEGQGWPFKLTKESYSFHASSLIFISDKSINIVVLITFTDMRRKRKFAQKPRVPPNNKYNNNKTYYYSPLPFCQTLKYHRTATLLLLLFSCRLRLNVTTRLVTVEQERRQTFTCCLVNIIIFQIACQ